MDLAEREGFEPSVENNPHTRLAGEHHRPTRSSLQILAYMIYGDSVAEGVGFEPTVLSHNGFQDRRLQPLGHPSNKVSCISPLKNSFLFQNTGANPLILLGVILAEQHFSTDYYIMLKKNCQPLKNKGILQNSRQAELPFL